METMAQVRLENKWVSVGGRAYVVHTKERDGGEGAAAHINGLGWRCKVRPEYSVRQVRG